MLWAQQVYKATLVTLVPLDQKALPVCRVYRARRASQVLLVKQARLVL